MLLLSPTPENITEAIDVLACGGIVVHATETCYGLACDLSNSAAVERLFAIKDRPADQPVSALFSSIDEAKLYVEWNNEAEALAKEFLPGPLTIILKFKANPPLKLLTTNYERQTDAIGVRLSSHPLAQALVALFGSPLSTTSANIHGRPPLYDPHAIMKELSTEEHQPDLILDSGVLPPVPPSRIVDCTQPGVPTVLRM